VCAGTKARGAGATALVSSDRLTHAKASLVELRLRSSRRPSEDRSDFPVLVAVDVVKDQGRAEAFRQSTNGSLKQDAIGQTFEALIGRSGLGRRAAVLFSSIGDLVQGDFVEAFLAEAHQDGVASDAVEPSRKRGVALKVAQATKDSEKGFLGEVLRERRITNHAKAQGIDAVRV